MLPRTWTRIREFRRHTLLLPVLLLLLLWIPSVAAEIGFGPGFSTCGDNCQTQLRLFCTENRDAEQQQQCWCGEAGLDVSYNLLADGCLSTCEDAEEQKDLISRYQAVVCAGTLEVDPEFEEYYSTRYGGTFVPDATKQAPPPVLPTTTTSRSTRSSSKLTSRTKTSSTPKPTTTASKTKLQEPTPTPTASPSEITLPVKTPSATASPASSPPLSSAQIVGISIASVAGFILIILALALLRRRQYYKNAAKRISPTPDSSMYPPASSLGLTTPSPTPKAPWKRWTKVKPILRYSPDRTSLGIDPEAYPREITPPMLMRRPDDAILPPMRSASPEFPHPGQPTTWGVSYTSSNPSDQATAGDSSRSAMVSVSRTSPEEQFRYSPEDRFRRTSPEDRISPSTGMGVRLVRKSPSGETVEDERPRGGPSNFVDVALNDAGSDTSFDTQSSLSDSFVYDERDGYDDEYDRESSGVWALSPGIQDADNEEVWALSPGAGDGRRR